MKVKPNNLFYGMLPSKKDKKKLLSADMGANFGPGPTGDPRIRQMIKTLPDNYFDIFGGQPQRSNVNTPLAQTATPPGQILNPQLGQPANAYNPGAQPNLPPKRINKGNAFLLGLEAIDAAIPNRIKNQEVIRPQMESNPYALGTGSQALEDGGTMMNLDRSDPMLIPEGMLDNVPGARNGAGIPFGRTLQYEDIETAKSGNWIQGAVNPKHKGYCTPMTKSTCTPRRKAFAMTMKKHHGFHKKKGGGIIPDPMSAFSPHMYPDGGQLQGGPTYNFRGVEGIPTPADSIMYRGKYAAAMHTDPGTFAMNSVQDQPSRDSAIGMAALRDVMLNRQAEYRKNLHRNWVNKDPTNRPKDNQPYANLLSSTGVFDAGGFLEHITNHPTAADMEGYADGGSLVNVMLMENIIRHPNQADMIEQAPNGKTQGPKAGYVPYGPQYSFGSIGRVPIKEDSSAYKTAYDAMRTGTPVVNEDRIRLQDTVIPALTHNAVWHDDPHSMSLLGDAYSRSNAYNDALQPGKLSFYLPPDTKVPKKKMKSGGSLSPAKAREMLHDKTAHGYKLTNRQRKYFGAAASGYAPDGTTMPGTFNAKNLTNSANSGIQDAEFVDKLNYILATGNHAKGNLGTQGKEGSDLLTSAYLWKQQNPTASPEDTIQGFYSRPVSGGNASDALRQRLGKIGYGPVAMYKNSPLLQLQERQGNFPPSVASNMRSGGQIMMYDDGGEIGTMWGGDVEQISQNPNDGGTMQFNGASHDDGGIGMHYNGNPVEVEGGETASRDSEGNLNIYGNMYLPGTRTKFKQVAKEIGKKEKRYDYLKTRGSELVNNSNPANKFEKLAFNAGQAMMQGGSVGQRDLAEKKENLATLQRSMLETAEEYGIDPQHMSKGKVKKARGGTYIPFAQDGATTSGDPNDPTRADRNKNPGNIRFGDWAKAHGAVKADKDGFAIFDDKEVGLLAMKSLLQSKGYSKLSVKDAINKWTGNKPYRYVLGDIASKRVGSLSEEDFSTVIDQMTKGEGTRYGAPTRSTPQNPVPTTPPTPRIKLPDIPLTPDKPINPPGKAVPPELGGIPIPEKRNLPSNVEPLHMNEVLGELYGAATNKTEPVPMQRYNPQEYTPYQVSFQDRLNQNQSTFNSLQRTLGATNPAALSAIAAQKYAADSGVKGEEFRTNQAISNDITNKNIALNNDAQLRNLGAADQQMVRQSTARSKTREFNQMIVNSLSSKYAQNQLENKRLAAYENLYDYRFVPTEQGGQQATYFGPDATFNYGRTPAAQANSQQLRTVSRYDNQGNLKGYTQYDESSLRDAKDAIELEMHRRKLPLLTVPPL